MGQESAIASTVRIYVPGMVRLGRDVHLNDFVHIWGGGGVILGDHVLVASHVVITSQSHDVNALASGLLYRETDDLRPVIVGRNVWIGSGACILPGVAIGDDSVIAAGSVVTRSVPARTLVMGVPARVVRQL
jgi:acetyltransferase-like isoleucine patch superfamily enzyme